MTLYLTISLDANAEKTLVLYGPENAISVIKQFYSRVQDTSKLITDASGPQAIMQVKEYKEILMNLIRRGVKRQLITEVTKENLAYCKLIAGAVELRHLEGIKGNFAVSETEYMATAILHKTEPVTQVIYSNATSVVEQHRYLFDTLWSRAIPADQIIPQIEQGIEPIRTRIIEDDSELFREVNDAMLTANKWSACFSDTTMKLTYNFYLDTVRKVAENLSKSSKGPLRWICNFDKNTIDLVRLFLDMGIEIRYSKNIFPMTFGVSERKFVATVQEVRGEKLVQSGLVSNEPGYIVHFNSLFEEMWKGAIDAREKIAQIEQGIEPSEIEIIDFEESVKRGSELILAAKREALVIFANLSNFKQGLSYGILELYKAATTKGVKVKLLVPYDDDIENTVSEVLSTVPGIEVRIADKDLQTQISVLLVDREKLIIWEVLDEARNPMSYGSRVTYSESRSIVSSFAVIFDSLWKQTEMNAALQARDELQKEFINIAAHELRTPVQPIVGMVELLEQEFGEKEDFKLIARNARRLHRLTEDILDVAKIESGLLNLNEQQFDINEAITDVIGNYGSGNNMRIVHVNSEGQMPVVADKERITQVISNLVSNAVKFAQAGEVTISAERKYGKAVVSVMDRGTGIDPSIIPRLFTRFASKSDKGTGLGLYISKSIIEAHGGRIWAESNQDGGGATFSFTLLLAEKK
jgi:signal transduction histidine kinase